MSVYQILVQDTTIALARRLLKVTRKGVFTMNEKWIPIIAAGIGALGGIIAAAIKEGQFPRGKTALFGLGGY